MSAHQWTLVGIMFAVTFGLRLAPFVARRTMKESRLLDALGALMPAGILVILVVNSFASIAPDAPIPAVLGLLVTAGLHLWKGSMALSLVGGVGAYGLALALLVP